VLIIVELVGHISAHDRIQLGGPALAILERWHQVVLIILAGTGWRMRMGELELANEEIETFEEIVLRDLERIVDAVDPPKRWLPKGTS